MHSCDCMLQVPYGEEGEGDQYALHWGDLGLQGVRAYSWLCMS